MKFKKIELDESLFDDTNVFNYSEPLDFYNDEYNMEIPSGPEQGSDTGIADLIITAINNEFETIKEYNSIVATLSVEGVHNPEYNSFIDVINDINNEENKHIGQLQEILKRISPNARSIDSGRTEGNSQLEFSNGLLKVQSWDEQPVVNNSPTTNDISNICTLSNIDDEM